MSFPTGWTRRCALVIQHTLVPGNLTALPVVITNASGCLPAEMVTTGDPNAAQSDGGDIRFSSDSSGVSQLACEIVNWVQDATAANAVAEIWVPVSVLSASDVTIYVWYSAGGGLSQPAANAAFGREAVYDSNFIAVQHMGTATAIVLTDSTANHNNMTNGTVPTAIAGKVGGGESFNGSSQNQSLPTANFTAGTTATLECWAQPSNTNPNPSILLSKDLYMTIRCNGGGSPWFNCAFDNGGWSGADFLQTAGSLTFNGTNWFHVVAVNTGTTFLIYINGALDNTLVDTKAQGNPVSLFVGKHESGLFYNGGMDELRLSKSARTADWIAAQYNNQNAPGSFIIAGSPSNPAGGGVVANPLGGVNPLQGFLS